MDSDQIAKFWHRKGAASRNAAPNEFIIVVLWSETAYFLGAKVQLSNRFYNAIIEHCHQHHDVQFYADLFCLSPKHFSSVVKQQTGQTAGYWIQHYLVIQLKQALTYEPETSIQAIANRFGFTEQASFARFFKKHTGVTPTEYRDGK